MLYIGTAVFILQSLYTGTMDSHYGSCGVTQVEEEELLVAELKKIEMRKKERERKQQDLQKLISAAEQNAEK